MLGLRRCWQDLLKAILGIFDHTLPSLENIIRRLFGPRSSTCLPTPTFPFSMESQALRCERLSIKLIAKAAPMELPLIPACRVDVGRWRSSSLFRVALRPIAFTTNVSGSTIYRQYSIYHSQCETDSMTHF